MNLFSHIRSAVPILDVIQKYVLLKSAGGYWKGSCPFHSEKTASFTVTPSRGIFYCFGCQAKGDVIAFIALIENCSQFEAACTLADEHNIAVEQFLSQKSEIAESHAFDNKKHFFDLMHCLNNFLRLQLQSNKIASQYVVSRKISPATIKLFEIGYFPKLAESLSQLQKHLAASNFTLKDLVDANILVEKGNGCYSPFEERIIYPIHDSLGRIVGLGGRVFLPGDERPKYYNSREHQYFNKSSILYGYNLAKKEIARVEHALVVEGYMDCIALVQNGYLNSVATLGTALTSEHLKVLARSANTIYVTYDGDNAGQKAMLRLTQLCWEANLEMKCVILPNGEDPASFLGKGGDLKKRLQDAIDIFSFYISKGAESYHTYTLKDKLITVHKLLDILSGIDDGLKREILIQQAAQALGLPQQTLRQEIELIKSRDKKFSDRNNSVAPDNPKPEKVSLSKTDKMVLGAIARKPDLMSAIPQELFLELSPQVQKTLTELKEFEKHDDFFQIHVKMLESANLDNSRLFEAVSAEDPMNIEPQAVIQEALRLNWKAISARIKQDIAIAKEKNDLAAMQTLLKKLEVLKIRLINQGGTHG